MYPYLCLLHVLKRNRIKFYCSITHSNVRLTIYMFDRSNKKSNDELKMFFFCENRIKYRINPSNSELKKQPDRSNFRTMRRVRFSKIF